MPGCLPGTPASWYTCGTRWVTTLLSSTSSGKLPRVAVCGCGAGLLAAAPLQLHRQQAAWALGNCKQQVVHGSNTPSRGRCSVQPMPHAGQYCVEVVGLGLHCKIRGSQHSSYWATTHL